MNKQTNKIHFLILLFIQVYGIISSFAQFPNYNFGCSVRGCNPQGTFALPSPIPFKLPGVKWKHTFDGDEHPQSVGCSSSISAVMCPTPNGLVSLEPELGSVNWESSRMNSSFLPIVDFYGNAITSNTDQFSVVSNDGSQLYSSVNTSMYDSHFGVVTSEVRIATIKSIVLTASTTKNMPQIVAFSGFGFEGLSSLALKGTVDGVNGTYVACADPVVNTTRLYVVTCFTPDAGSNGRAPGLSRGTGRVYAGSNGRAPGLSRGTGRVYAINLPSLSTSNLTVAWFYDLPNHRGEHDDFPISLMFFKNTVYINYVALEEGNIPSPHPRTVALSDQGHSSRVVFDVASTAGQMSIYDVTGSPWVNISASDRKLIWVTQEQPPSITALDPNTGAVMTSVPIPEFISAITTFTSVTRLPETGVSDVLVFGGQDGDGHVHLVALEAGFPALQPRLLWSLDVSELQGLVQIDTAGSKWNIGKQIVNVVYQNAGSWQFGLVVMVTETGTSYSGTNHIFMLT